jgi:nickel-dependent lactate racemase
MDLPSLKGNAAKSGALSFEEFLQGGRRILIIINDAARPTLTAAVTGDLIKSLCVA